MQPPCPQPQQFEIVTGFITPGSDFPPPHPLDASISVDVFDAEPGESSERIRIVETDAPFNLVVDWCICGGLAASICGCWTLDVYIDDIDGVGPTSGKIGSATVDVASVPPQPTPDPTQRCYEYTFAFPGGTVQAGVYDLVVVITLQAGSCNNPGPRLGDWLGYAEIPVLVFFDG